MRFALRNHLLKNHKRVKKKFNKLSLTSAFKKTKISTNLVGNLKDELNDFETDQNEMEGGIFHVRHLRLSRHIIKTI